MKAACSSQASCSRIGREESQSGPCTKPDCEGGHDRSIRAAADMPSEPDAVQAPHTRYYAAKGQATSRPRRPLADRLSLQRAVMLGRMALVVRRCRRPGYLWCRSQLGCTRHSGW